MEALRAGADSALNGLSGLVGSAAFLKEGAREGAIRLHEVEPRLHDAGNPGRQVHLACQDGLGCLFVLHVHLVVECLDQVFLGGEVVVSVADRDPGLGRHGPHRGVVVAPFPEQAQGGFQDRGPGPGRLGRLGGGDRVSQDGPGTRTGGTGR